MNRHLILILVVFLISLGLLYFGVDALLPLKQVRSHFPTVDIFVFNAIFSLFLLGLISYMSTLESVKSNLGFVYLISVLVKPFVFIAVFKDLVFNSIPINTFEAILMLLPTLLSLFFEVLYCSKILKKTIPKKKRLKE